MSWGVCRKAARLGGRTKRADIVGYNCDIDF